MQGTETDKTGGLDQHTMGLEFSHIPALPNVEALINCAVDKLQFFYNNRYRLGLLSAQLAAGADAATYAQNLTTDAEPWLRKLRAVDFISFSLLPYEGKGVSCTLEAPAFILSDLVYMVKSEYANSNRSVGNA